MEPQHIPKMKMSAERPWWIEHRRHKYRKMTLELIIRRSLRETLKEYVNNCSIGGLQQMCEPNIYKVQRLVRVCIFCSMACFLSYMLYETWTKTFSTPLIVSTESTTYPIADIDFPAVALCNINRISKKAVKMLAKQTYSYMASKNQTLKEVEEFFLQAGRLVDFSYDEILGKGNSFLDALVEGKYNMSNSQAINTMFKLAPNCSEMLMQCAWAGEEVPCATLFTVRRTARGHCCAFNYVLDYDSAEAPKSTLGEPKRQRLPGYIYGLTVLVDPMLYDYAYPLSHVLGFDVLLYDPSHFADLSAGRIIHRIAEPNHVVFLEIKSIKQVASPEVRKYPVSTRKCLFKDELKSEFNGMYSYSACIVRCRIKTIQSLCKCTPYYLPVPKDEGPICTLDDLKCLSKYKEKLLYLYPLDSENSEGLEVELEDSLYCPNCLPDCELTQHSTKALSLPMERMSLKSYYMNSFVQDINITNKCLIAIYHPVADGMLDSLDAVSYWFEIMSNIGGLAGVILGLSVFSAVEIIYYLCVRFIIVLYCNYKQHR